ncbi:MAG: Geranylgeranyl pyrophosphate synthase [Thermodesulfobacterium sp.]|uniref:Geranylgeranyl pyrophosphate synthase n=1 Tax=Candidatus Thermodesulfobacterium syntrophicum TaxID=3060442 RepID=A0AAE3P664_9BACT|nr:Geranylgeranyl pyrophosphate synthase [Candidatus Thermodesulfobacterium syntrophicum]
MNNFNPLEIIKSELNLIENTLKTYLDSQHSFINQVSKYIIFSGGKRIRPLLTILSAKLFLNNPINKEALESLYRTSILFEYLHAATLLHDDVVDDAQFRRGRRAAKNLWGNQATILVGDYLYAKALRIASLLENPKVMNVITQTTLLMSEGEVLQLINLDNHNLTESEYEEVIFRKTAVLISACCEVGAILGGAKPNECLLLKNFGKYLGLAFQIVDDLLDYLSEETGKDLGKDFKEGKVTLPVIYALKSAEKEEKNKLLSLFKTPNPTQEDFETAKKIIEKNKGFVKSKEKAQHYITLAKKCLKELPNNLYKYLLLFISDYLLERKK